MKILIFGAGGVGSVVGGFLARMGHEVSLLGRAWHLDQIKKQGLFITGIWGDYRIKAFNLFTSAAELGAAGPEFDLIILTVKSYDTAQAAEELAPFMGPETMLLSLQNGLGNIEAILKHVRPEQFLAGRVIFGAELEAGVAKVTVNADDVVLGTLPGIHPKRSAVQTSHTLSLAGVPARAVTNILTYIWSKVIYNCALNGICSLHKIPYGRILEREDTREQMKNVVRECYAVGLKAEVVLDPDMPEDFLDLLTGSLIPKTAAHFPSMLQDLKKGKRTDIDALNGAIWRLGNELGVPTPENQKITQEIYRLSRSSPGVRIL